MGFWKTMGHVMLIKGAILTGYLMNNGDRGVNGFELHKEGHEVMLYSENLGKGYEINVMEDEIFLGDASHNYNGMRALTNYELVFEEIPFSGDYQPKPGLLETITNQAESIIRGDQNE